MNESIKKFILAFVVINIFSVLLFSLEMGELGKCFINGGVYYDLNVDNNIAYIASQFGLLILDVTDSESPQPLASYETPGTALSLDLHNNILAISYLYHSIDFIDVTDPSNPIKISTFYLENSPFEFRDISLSDCLAVTYLDNGNLVFLDLNDINNPSIINEIPGISTSEIEVINDYLYELKFTHSSIIFQIYNISDPENPLFLGSEDLSGWMPNQFVIKDNFAYVASDTGSLQIVDISDLNNPNLISECTIPNMVSEDVVVTNNYAYLIGSGENSYSIVEISDPNNPELIEGFDFTGSNIEICNSKVYICTNSGNIFTNNGLAILDITNPESFDLDTHFKSGLAEKLQVINDIAFIANGFTGLTILDSSNPNEITHISNYQTSDTALDVIIDSTTAFVAVNENGVEIIDVSNLTEPELLSQIDTEYGKIRTLAKKDNNLYFGGEDEYCIYAYNIEDLENPQLLQTIPVNDFSFDLTIYDDYLYLAGYWGGLQIFDISDSENVVELCSYPLSMAYSVTAGDDLVFINGNGLHIFDTSSFANPYIIETLDTGASDMHYQDNQLYFSFDGIYLYDLSNTEDIVETMHIPDCNPRGIAPVEDKIYSIEKFKFIVYGDTTEVFSDDNELQESSTFANITNYPNPFNPSTTIEFSIQNNSEVEISIFNVKGQLIKTISQKRYAKGSHSIIWNGDDEFNKQVCSGIYFYKLNLNGKNVATNKCILLK